MKAVILAGGLGTRFAEETTLRPKPMIEIGGFFVPSPRMLGHIGEGTLWEREPQRELAQGHLQGAGGHWLAWADMHHYCNAELDRFIGAHLDPNRQD